MVYVGTNESKDDGDESKDGRVDEMETGVGMDGSATARASL